MENLQFRLRGNESAGEVSLLEKTVPCRMRTIISRAGASVTGTWTIVGSGVGGAHDAIQKE